MREPIRPPHRPVQGNGSVIARFFKAGNKTMVAIQYAGDAGQEAVAKVTPELIAQFPEQWDAFVHGLDLPEPEGTPLTEIPGLTEQVARVYKLVNINVCEQLADASDAVIQRLGIGASNFRKMAKIIVAKKKVEDNTQALIDAAVKKAVAATDAPKAKATKVA
jgi:hypothetical protein